MNYNNNFNDIARNIVPAHKQMSDVLRKHRDEQSAQKFATNLHKQILEFENDLDEDFEVGVRLVSFGQTITFHVSAIGCTEPSLIIFRGYTDNNEPVELIQHVNQISFLLMKIKRLDKSEERRSIGFITSDME